MKSTLKIISGFILSLLSCICLFGMSAMAQSYSASSMRLLRYEGDVEILDAEGESRFILENARFHSGETMQTGKDSNASVELEEQRIVTLDSQTRVEFVQEGDSMKMDLKEGTILLDVENKLDENEALDIQTSNMTVGIRGTIVYLTNLAADDERLNQQSESTRGQILPFMEQAADSSEAAIGADGAVTVFGVLEGNADISWMDTDGTQRSVNVPAGQKAVILANEAAGTLAGPVVSPMEQNDISGFMEAQLTAEQKESVRTILAQGAESTDLYGYSADNDWTYCGLVILVAQSASKMYDGTPLIENNILVSGLPEGFTVQAETGGSQTDAGTCENPVSHYSILNAMGEDVTSHFVNIETRPGQLVVDPAPLTVTTDSAEKVYDGTPLQGTKAELKGYSGLQEIKTGQNISYINTQPFAADPDSGSILNGTGDAAKGSGSEVLYGIIGEVLVHGTNPLTQETREIRLFAGQKLTVQIMNREDPDGESSIAFVIETMTEEEIPEEVLRLYADNPDVLNQACRETGWDIEIIRKRIDDLPETEEKLVQENGVQVREDSAGSTLQDFTSVWIHIDSDITNYNNRSLGTEEASFIPVTIDASIKVTPSGSQTQAGSSTNTYVIDWGTANPDNYKVSETLGTLTVTPAPAAVTTGSAQKPYDGTALTNKECSITGLAEGETITVVTTGSQTEVGSSPNTCTINWDGTAKETNYTITENLGTLTVTSPLTKTATVTTGSASKVYDGIALTGEEAGEEATITGLMEGDTAIVKATGSRTDVGTSTNTYTIEWGENNKYEYTVVEELGTLTVTPAEITVTTGSAQKPYDGTALTNKECSITGLAEGETITVVTTGSQTEVGSSPNTCTITWDGTAKETNYTITENLGTLTVTSPLTKTATVTTGSASKVYDGIALTGEEAGEEATITGLMEGDTAIVKATGSRTDVGISTNTYTIEWGENNKYEYTVVEELGTLEVTPLPVTFRLNCYDATFNGLHYFPDGINGTYADGSEAECVNTEFTDDEMTGTFTLTGGAVAELTCSGVRDAGTYTITPAVRFTAGSADNYAFSYENTEMSISPLEMEFELGGSLSEQVPYVYDGEFHGGDLRVSCEEESYDTEQLSDTTWQVLWPFGDVIDVEITGGGTDAGTCSLTEAITFSSGNPENYDITVIGKTLFIDPAPLTITTEGASKIYDGTPLTNSNFTVEGLAGGETVTITTTGTITTVGTTPNSYTITWDGTAKEANYTITDQIGTLEILGNNTPVTFTTASAEKTYDGTPLEDNRVSVTGLPAGFTYEASAGGSVGYPPDTGEYENEFTDFSYSGVDEGGNPFAGWRLYFIYDESGNDVTDYFTNVTLVKGTLTIHPAPLTVATGSASKVYDGTALTSPEASLTGLVNNETASVAANGSITEVGTAQNTYTITWDGTAKESNYEIAAENLGTLEILKKPAVTFTIGSIRKEYDGEPLTGSGELTVSGLPDGCTYALAGGFITGSQTDVGTSEITYDPNAIMVLDETGFAADVDIIVVPGTRTVTPCEITFNLDGYTSTYEEYSRYICYSITGVFDSTGIELDGVSTTHTSVYTDGSYFLQGDDEVTISVSSINPDGPGTYRFSPSVAFIAGNASNYNIKFINDTVILD